MLVITVRFRINDGFEERFLARAAQQASDSLGREAACRQFDVCASPADPRLILLYEIYDDDAAFAAHLASAHFLAFDQETRGWIADKVVERWTRT